MRLAHSTMRPLDLGHPGSGRSTQAVRTHPAPLVPGQPGFGCSTQDAPSYPGVLDEIARPGHWSGRVDYLADCCADCFSYPSVSFCPCFGFAADGVAESFGSACFAAAADSDSSSDFSSEENYRAGR